MGAPSKRRDSWTTSGRRGSWSWPFWQRIRVKPKGCRGRDRIARGGVQSRKPGHWRTVDGRSLTDCPLIAQPAEPPYTDPYVRWCNRESGRPPTYVD